MSLKYNRITVFGSFIRFLLLKNFYKKIILGAGGISIKGYLKTEQSYFDIEHKWKYFKPNKLEAIIAEHVFEHLDHPELAARHCYDALKAGGELTIAVPAGPQAKDKEYGHKRVFTEDSLSDMLKTAGFVELQRLIIDSRIRRENSLIIKAIK